jgi:nitrate reductase (NAD(P)H)
VVNNTEEWIKYKEDWPANIQKRRRAEEAKQKEQGGEGKEKDNRQDGQKEEQNRGSRQEHEMRRESGENKYHEAYPQASGRTQQQQQIGQAQTNDDKEKDETDNQKLSDKYSPQEIALLRSLEQESEYVRNMKQNNGKGTSPVGGRSQLVSIDEADQFSPDNWIPRSEHLVRLTGKHPLNAEPELTTLFEAGLITPNELHYVRNHGAVPHLLWETHTLDIGGGKLQLSMDDLKNNFPPINIPVALACDGNRRKELNLIRRSKGFNWGAGAVSCAYWKGPLLRDVLLSAGIHRDLDEETRYWVNFEGADELSEGRYATSIPLDYAMDKNNDVILAYEMNDVPLPPDHGHPVRLVIPGYVGGRCVKWLKKIWISDKENASHYHIWDNRVLPSFITETDGEFAETMFAHPDTACNEQNLNSVIVKPAHGERLKLTEARKGKTYRVQGYAYDGGGHAVQGVEVSLDGGETWLYCVRNVR